MYVPHWGPPLASPPSARTRFDSRLERDCGKRTITPKAELIFKSGGFSRGRREEGVPTGQAESSAPGPLCRRQSFPQAAASGCVTRRATEKPQEQPEPREPHQHPEVSVGTRQGAPHPQHTHTDTHAQVLAERHVALIISCDEEGPRRRGTPRYGRGQNSWRERSPLRLTEEEGWAKGQQSPSGPRHLRHLLLLPPKQPSTWR